MKLLLIHQVFASSQDAGGTRHFELGQRLLENGDALTVVTSQISYLTGQPLHPEVKGLVYRENIKGIEILRAYAPAVHNRSFTWRILGFIIFSITSIWAGLRSGPVDLVMGTTPPIFQAVSAWILARLRRKSFLLEVRDLWPEFAIDMGVLRNPILKAFARWLERFLYRHSDRILVNSPAYREYLLGKGIAGTKIEFVSNGVDIDMFDPAGRGEAIRQQFGLDGKVLVVYAGALGMANDLGTVLRAADLLRDRPEIHFLFVGDGKERINLEREAEHLALPNVTFVGAVRKEQMPQVLEAADICTATLMNIPMFAMTYPNKVFDYMAAGRPTVLAIDGVIRQVIENAEGGMFVPPGDPGGLASAVERLANDPDLRTHMGRSARSYVAENFNRKEQGNEFRKILQSLRP